MNATHALGWALVHFVWQGAAAAVLLGVLLALIGPGAARLRYGLCVATLGLMLAFPILTVLRNDGTTPVVDVPAAFSDAPANDADDVVAPATTSAPSPVTATASPSLMLATWIEGRLPWLVALWVAGVLVLSARLAGGWAAVRRLREVGTRDAPQGPREILGRLAARLRVSRPVQLLESALVDVPAVIGWLRPVILVPASALTGLTPQQLEVLLAHELAHVRRHDYLVNVAQAVIETLLFYHPAVWWVSRRVREEREHCCDDLAVAVCGDAHFYAAALAGMERLRTAPPQLALAATGAEGSSLLHRIRRLVAPATVRPRAEILPRWAAGVVAVTVALTSVGGARLAGEAAADVSQATPADTLRTAPDTVLRHPDAAQPLSQRWDWAHAQARQLRRSTYWIGYTVRRPDWLENAVYVDRGAEIHGHGITLQGRGFGDFQGFAFRGVRLGSVTGTRDSDDILMLFGFTAGAGGRPALTHVHVGSAFLPVDFARRTLFWLGTATDAQSLPLVEGLFAAAAPVLKEDLVAGVGIHGSSGAVVPVLIRWLNGSEPTPVREQAAAWLGFHPDAAAVQALARAARSDRASDVRREAAEALGDNTLPAATDSLLAVARTGGDPDTRREAVEGIGAKDQPLALSTLQGIAKNDPDPDVQRAAVETLGQLGAAGLNALIDVIRTHPNTDVRREAVETLGESAPTAETARLLAGVARDDRSEDVQREAVETLGELEGALGLPAVIDIARTHPSSDVRRQAVETIGQVAPVAQALDLLLQFAKRDPDSDVQRQAVETLGELQDPHVFGLIADLARSHPVSDVRRQAVETLGEKGPTDSVIAVLDAIAQRTADPDAARQAVETLGELKDRRALDRLAAIARTHHDIDVRRQAIETYAEAATAEAAIALIKEILANEAPEDIERQALESLEELDGGAGIPLLIEMARSHPRREVRTEAIRRLAESDDPRARQLFEETLRRP
jgi:HEAT repeat protein/beta-lactamase regulating signal transducer with metallopeptidase domain